MNSNLVSIIVPCYKQAQFLNECLQSVMEQSYTNLECIIVNDGSPDNTEEIAKVWTKKDNRFKYLSTENKGVSNARNVGITSAKGYFILPLDADDKISNNYIELAVKKFQEDTKLSLVYCKAKKFGEVNENWNLPVFSLQEFATESMIFCTAMYKKHDWEKLGGYDISMKTGLEDWEFWIALLKNGAKVFQLDIIGFHYRIKKTSRHVNLKANQSNLDNLFNYLSIKHSDFFVKQFGSFIALQTQIQNLNQQNKQLIYNNKQQPIIFFLKKNITKN